MKHQVT